MMLGGDDDILHARFPGAPNPGIGIEIHRVETLGQGKVLGFRDPRRRSEHRLGQIRRHDRPGGFGSRHGISPPMNEETELGIPIPLKPLPVVDRGADCLHDPFLQNGSLKGSSWSRGLRGYMSIPIRTASLVQPPDYTMTIPLENSYRVIPGKLIVSMARLLSSCVPGPRRGTNRRRQPSLWPRTGRVAGGRRRRSVRLSSRKVR